MRCSEGDYSSKTLMEYEQRVKRSWITPELRRYRNFHAGFRHGRWLGMANAGLAVHHRRPRLGHARSGPPGIRPRSDAEAVRLWLSRRAMRASVTRTCGSTDNSPSIKLRTSITRRWPMMKISQRIFTCSTQIFAPLAARKNTEIRASDSVPAAVYEMVETTERGRRPNGRKLQINFLELRPLQDLRHHGSLPDN